MTGRLTLQATVVAVGNIAVLIRGESGTGKSGLALQMMAAGATLIGDDGVELDNVDGALVAHPVPATEGLIEARHVGLLRVPYSKSAVVRYVVDLDTEAGLRLPHRETDVFMGVELRVIFGKNAPNLAAALTALLSGGMAV